MAIVTLPYTFSVGAVILAAQHNSNFSTIYSDYNGNIQDVNIASNAAIGDSKLAKITTAGKVSGTSLTSLSSIPSGAGLIPSANIPIATPLSYIKCSNTQTQNTSAGTATSGSWLIAIINTKDTDTGGIATLSSNQISLPSGTYQVFCDLPFYATSGSQIRLFNVTDSSIIINGTSTNTDTATSASTGHSFIIGQFTIAGSKAISVQYQVGVTKSTSGQGIAQNFGTEVYLQIEIIKIS